MKAMKTKALKTAVLALVLLAGVSGTARAQRANYDSLLLTGGPCLVRSDAAGSPEGRLVGNPCDVFIRSDGGAGTTVYRKESGVATNTGWVAIPTIPVPATQGGTGQTVYAIGDLLYADTTTSLAKLAGVAAGSYVRSAGVGVAPVWSTLVLPNAATANQIAYASATDTVGFTATLPTGVQDNITRLGTITSGIWNAGAVTSSGAISGTTGTFSLSSAGGNIVSITNTNAGAGYSQLTMGSRGGVDFYFTAEDGIVDLEAALAGGLGLRATHASGAIRFYTGGTTKNVEFEADGDAWFIADVSALSFTDRTPYPVDLATARAAVLTMRRLPDEAYQPLDLAMQLDHATLHPSIRSKNGMRDLSATVSSLIWVAQDYDARIAALEAATKENRR